MTWRTSPGLTSPTAVNGFCAPKSSYCRTSSTCAWSGTPSSCVSVSSCSRTRTSQTAATGRCDTGATSSAQPARPAKRWSESRTSPTRPRPCGGLRTHAQSDRRQHGGPQPVAQTRRRAGVDGDLAAIDDLAESGCAGAPRHAPGSPGPTDACARSGRPGPACARAATPRRVPGTGSCGIAPHSARTARRRRPGGRGQRPEVLGRPSSRRRPCRPATRGIVLAGRRPAASQHEQPREVHIAEDPTAQTGSTGTGSAAAPAAARGRRGDLAESWARTVTGACRGTRSAPQPVGLDGERRVNQPTRHRQSHTTPRYRPGATSRISSRTMCATKEVLE